MEKRESLSDPLFKKTVMKKSQLLGLIGGKDKETVNSQYSDLIKDSCPPSKDWDIIDRV